MQLVPTIFDFRGYPMQRVRPSTKAQPTTMETVEESRISSHVRMLACTSCKQYVANPSLHDLLSPLELKPDHGVFGIADVKRDVSPIHLALLCMGHTNWH